MWNKATKVKCAVDAASHIYRWRYLLWWFLLASMSQKISTIASMLLSDAGLKPYTDTAYHNEELKSLTRYRFDKVKERAKLKSSIARLVCILFPELEKR